jgi:MFS family permease
VRSFLVRDRDFVRLWAGQAASQFGAQASQVTLPLIAVVALGLGATQLGLLRAAQQVPILLFSLFVGVWVDRWRVRNLMVFADAGRALTLAAVPIAFALGVLGVPLLLTVAFLVGAFSVVFDIAYQACLTRLVERRQLAQGNSMLESTRSAAQIGGPALGGALVSLLSAPIAILASAFFFTLSFLAIKQIRRNEVAPQDGEQQPGILKQIREGLHLMVGDASLRTIGISSALFQFSFAAMMTLYLLFLPRTLHLSSAELGLVLGALGPGALVGSMLSAKLPRRVGYGVVFVWSAVIADGVMICVPALRGAGVLTVVLLMAVNFVFGVFTQLVDVSTTVIRQAITPVGLQGRVVAALYFTGMGLTPLGSLLGGCLGDLVGLRAGLLVATLGMLLSPLVIGLSPLARLGKELPKMAGAQAIL